MPRGYIRLRGSANICNHAETNDFLFRTGLWNKEHGPLCASGGEACNRLLNLPTDRDRKAGTDGPQIGPCPYKNEKNDFPPTSASMQRIAAILLISVLLACKSRSKLTEKTIYFEDSSGTSGKPMMARQAAYTVKPGDMLSIKIGALNKAFTKDFLLDNSEPGGSTVYSVDAQGNIKLPQLGKTALAGLTLPMAEAALEARLEELIKGPVVQISLLNFRVQVLGEVNKPGNLKVPDGNIDVLEAIGQSGDLTVYGRRENVLVVRTEKDSTKSFGRIDLTKRDLFRSSYFQLKQGDIVYVEPKKEKLLATDFAREERYRQYGLLLGAISALAIIVNLFRR